MSKLTLHSTPFSTYGRTCRMALHWKGVDYTLDPAAPQSPEQQERHPWGKVPAMTHTTTNGDVKLYETLAICAYIDRAFDGRDLLPANATERGIAEQWISVFQQYTYTPVVGIIVQRIFVPARGGTPDEAVVKENMVTSAKALGVLDAALADGGYFGGGGLSLADFLVLPLVDYLPRIPEGEALLADIPNIRRWQGVMHGLSCARDTAPPPMG